MFWLVAPGGPEGEASTLEDIEIESPDAPSTTSRMLHFLYTGELLPATADQLLQVQGVGKGSGVHLDGRVWAGVDGCVFGLQFPRTHKHPVCRVEVCVSVVVCWCPSLQDLVTSDRFGMSSMKTMCENTLPVTVDNCARLLELSDLLSAPRLREVSVTCWGWAG